MNDMKHPAITVQHKVLSTGISRADICVSFKTNYGIHSWTLHQKTPVCKMFGEKPVLLGKVSVVRARSRQMVTGKSTHGS